MFGRCKSPLKISVTIANIFAIIFFLAYQLLKIDSGEKYAVWSGTAELTLDTDRALT